MSNLPELEGSEKQIAWAKDIRENYVSVALEVKAGLEKVISTGDTVDETGWPILSESQYGVARVPKESRYFALETSMKDTPLYEWVKAAEKYSPERKKRRAQYKKEVAKKALSELNKVMKKELAVKSAHDWIENRYR